MSQERVRCFLLEDTGRDRLSLRRYVESGKERSCSGPMGYHNAMAQIGEQVSERYPEGHKFAGCKKALLPEQHDGDPRWPTHCACGYEFQPDDRRQVFTESIYRRADTGEEMRLEDAPAGAIWNSPWLAEWKGYRGPDGQSLHVRLPNGRDWRIDGRASNCTLPNDQEHKCWVRHGTPPDLTVDKNGLTCAAGAGSIQAGDYHGFLRGGFLERC
jgi:hypothetical protein